MRQNHYCDVFPDSVCKKCQALWWPDGLTQNIKFISILNQTSATVYHITLLMKGKRAIAYIAFRGRPRETWIQVRQPGRHRPGAEHREDHTPPWIQRHYRPGPQRRVSRPPSDGDPSSPEPVCAAPEAVGAAPPLVPPPEQAPSPDPGSPRWDDFMEDEVIKWPDDLFEMSDSDITSLGL